MAPDVIVSSSNQVTAILQQETRTIPIVFVFIGDPIGSGFVANFSWLDKNLTGFPVFETEIGGKWLEVLRGDRTQRCPRRGRFAYGKRPLTPGSCVRPRLRPPHLGSS